MTLNGWVQIVLFGVLLTLIVQPLGGYMTRVFEGKPTLLSPVLRPVERGIYVACGVDERAGAALGHLCRRHAGLQSRRLRRAVRLAAAAGRAAVQPAASGCGGAGPGLQHLGQLRHQHQLAVVRAGNHDELSRADGGADGAQLRLRGNRHRARHRADPRLRPALGADRSAISGSI